MQTRTCVNVGTCKVIRPTKIETRECTIDVPEPVIEAPPVIDTAEPTPEAEMQEEETKSRSWIVYTILFIIVFGGIGFAFYEIQKSRKHVEAEKQMHHEKLDERTYTNLENYARNTMQMGYTKEQIRKAMISEGWNPDIANEVLSRIR